MNRMMKYLIFVCAITALGAADVSLKNGPPYKPPGWHPSRLLPGEYGAPPVPASVQVSQENLRFVGQVVEVTTAAVPKNAYLPPSAQQQFALPNAAQVQVH